MADQENADTENDVVIRARKNGPYVVKGPVRLLDVDGEEWDIAGKKSVSLCRCGASLTKPFCDGTHSQIGFAAAEQAVREAEGR